MAGAVDLTYYKKLDRLKFGARSEYHGPQICINPETYRVTLNPDAHFKLVRLQGIGNANLL